MNKEALLAELNRLLDAGEPLLTKFPAKYSGSWLLELPDNISDEMVRCANNVALRAWYREGYWDHRQRDSTDFLAKLVNACDAGLLGWRAIGVLK